MQNSVQQKNMGALNTQANTPMNNSASGNSNRQNWLNKKSVWLFVGVVAAVIGLLFYYLFHQSSTTNSNSNTTSTPSSQLATAPESSDLLIFQPFLDNHTSTITVNDSSGKVIHTLKSDPGSGTYSQGFSQSLGLLKESTLITVNKNWTKFAVVTPNGNAKPVSSALVSLLGGRAHPKSPSFLETGVTIGESTLVAMKQNRSSSVQQLVRINLLSGKVTNLLQLDDLHDGTLDYNPIRMVGISNDNNSVYILTSDVKIDSDSKNGLSLISYSLANNRYNTRKLPNYMNFATATVDHTGNLIGYVAQGVNKAKNAANDVTHFYNLQTGKDVRVAKEGLSVGGDSNGLQFSADDKYLSENGFYAADTDNSGMALQIISVANQSLVRQIDFMGDSNDLTAVGWMAEHIMVYTTNFAGTSGPLEEDTHSIDPESNVIFDFPAGLGQLFGVLSIPG